MPRLLRIALTGSAFAAFFSFSFVFGGLLLPLLLYWPGDPEHKRRRRERAVCGVYRAFTAILHYTRLIRYRRPELPPDFPREGGCVVISNHPSLIDTLMLMGLRPGLSSVIKPWWTRSRWTRRLMRYANHIPGPDRVARLPGHVSKNMVAESDEDDETPAVLTRMVEHLRAGHGLVIFPEGSRSFERKLRRFRRGAIEAAIRAGVPIVPAFIGVNPPMLMKHQPWYEVPDRPGAYRVEFFPTIHTAGRDLDARAINRELRAIYEARFLEHLRERDASAPAPAPIAQLAGPQSLEK